MICRIWRGWTEKQNADAYDAYLKDALFPRLQKELPAMAIEGSSYFGCREATRSNS